MAFSLQVLQPTTSQWAPSPSLNAIMKDLTMEQNIEEIKEEDKIQKDYGENDESVVNKRIDPKKRVVSLIVQELQQELERPIQEVIIIYYGQKYT